MGVYKLTDFRDEVRYVCGGISSSSPALTDARLDRRINHSYLWCCMPNHYRHPELEATEYLTLATGTAAYSPTNTYYHIVSVSHCESTLALLTDEIRRYKLDPVEIREQSTIIRTARQPRLYSYWNNDIILSSVPDTSSVGQVLELRGYRQPPVLSAATTTLLKAEWDEIIVVGAEWRMWIALNEHDRAYQAKENLGQLVNEVADIRRLHISEEWGWQTGIDSEPHMRTD